MRAGFVATSVVVGALSFGAAAQAAIPSGNLVQNGNAESGVGATDSSSVAPVPIPGWTTTPNFTEHAYVTGAFPDPAVSAAIGGGKQFFAGGPDATGDNTNETASQDVDLSAAGADLDAGGVSATLAAVLGGYSSQDDTGAVTATFLSATGGTLGRVTIGPVTAADRTNTTNLLARSASAAVPAGTRKVRVVITAAKTEGDYNDGYIDNVSLTLTGSGATTTPPPTTPPPPALPTRTPPATGPKGNPLGLPSARRCVSSRRMRLRLHHARGTRIVSVKAFVNGRRAASRHGSSIRRLTLTRLPHKRFVLRVVAKQSNGARLVSRRVYKPCRNHQGHRHHRHHRHR